MDTPALSATSLIVGRSLTHERYGERALRGIALPLDRTQEVAGSSPAARDPAKQRDGRRVVARHERGDLRDPCRVRVGNQLRGESRSDALLLVLVVAARRANIPADSVVEVAPAAAQVSGRLRDWAAAVPSS